MLVSSAGLSGRLRRLETEGWIERRTSPDDGRSIIVQLTPAGSADLDGFLAEHYRFEGALLDSLSSDARAILAAKLRDLLLSLEPEGAAGAS
jgi:DNA-binding MarR family transcriptional regulator